MIKSKIMKQRISLVWSLMLIMLSGCGSDDETPQEEPLQNVTVEVLFWEFTPDTGNDTFRLHYEIEFHNPNDVAINGFYSITQNADGLISTLHSFNFSPCYQIEANSSCVFSFDEEDSFDIGMVNSIEFIAVEYNLEE